MCPLCLDPSTTFPLFSKNAMQLSFIKPDLQAWAQAMPGLIAWVVFFSSSLLPPPLRAGLVGSLERR